MKHLLKPTAKLSGVSKGGFSLPEMFIVSGVFLVLVAAFVATQLFASRVYTLAATKVTATASARKILNYLRDDIKGAGAVEVGIYNVTNRTYAIVPDGSPQIGNALLISPTNDLDTLYGTIYFMNPQSSNICSIVIADSVLQPSTLATNIISYITNFYVFDVEDSYTNIFTSYDNGRIIHIKLQFSQWEYPLAGVGNGAMYDFYQLQTRVAQRIPQPSY